MPKRVRVGDLEIAYQESGSGDRPFVLVHGFTGSSDDWADVLDDLGRRGRTLAPDNRGHGATGHTPRYDLAGMVDDLAGFLDEVAGPSCDLLGHSLGGMVALRLALRDPGRVHSLVLMDTAARAVSTSPRNVLEGAMALARSAGLRPIFEAMRAGAEAAWPASMRRAAEEMGHERYWRRIERKLEAMDPEAFVALGHELLDQAPLTGRLGEIACPTLVVVGADDTPLREPSEELAAGIPGADLAVVPGAAHSPQIENRSAWLEVITEHLARARG